MAAKLLEHVIGVDLAHLWCARDQRRAKAFPRLDQLCRGLGAVAKDQGDVIGGSGERAIQGDVQPVRHSDPCRLARGAKVAHGQAGVILPRRATAHHDRVMAAAHGMDHAAGGRGCDPLAFARRGRNATVKAVRELERHHRAAFVDTQEKAQMIRAGFIFEHAHVNDNARRTEDSNALAADAWITVGAGDHHARRLGGDKRIGAGRRLAGMGAGFEGDIDRRPLCRRSGLTQRLGFCMGPAARLGPAAPDNAALLHDDAAHGGIGPDSPLPAPAQRQGQRHKARVVRHAYSSAGVSGRSSCTNLSKSSAA